MATIDVISDMTRDLVVFRVVGELAAGELGKVLEQYYTGPVCKRCLFDLSEGTWSSIPVAHFQSGLERFGRFGGQGGRSAFVFGNDADFGIGRLIESRLALKNYEKPIECFRDLDEAYRWILE